MKVIFTKNLKIAHDGINATTYSAGDTCDLSVAHARRVIELGAAKLDGKSPVKENKKADLVIEDKEDKPKVEKTTKKGKK